MDTKFLKGSARTAFFGAFHRNGLAVKGNTRPARRKDGQSQQTTLDTIADSANRRSAKASRRAEAARKAGLLK